MIPIALVEVGISRMTVQISSVRIKPHPPDDECYPRLWPITQVIFLAVFNFACCFSIHEYVVWICCKVMLRIWSHSSDFRLQHMNAEQSNSFYCVTSLTKPENNKAMAGALFDERHAFISLFLNNIINIFFFCQGCLLLQSKSCVQCQK